MSRHRATRYTGKSAFRVGEDVVILGHDTAFRTAPTNQDPRQDTKLRYKGKEKGWPVTGEAIVCHTIGIEGFLYISGGVDSETHLNHSSVFAYDLEFQRISKASDMNVARSGHSSCILGDRLYVIDGINQPGNEEPCT